MERLVRFCLLQPAIRPFIEATSCWNAIQILMGFSELELVGFVLCLYLALSALWDIFKKIK